MRPAAPIVPAHDWTEPNLSAMQRAKWGLMGLLKVRLHPAPFGLRLALAKACTTSGSHDLRESPGLAGRTPVGSHLHQPTQTKKPAQGGLFVWGG